MYVNVLPTAVLSLAWTLINQTFEARAILFISRDGSGRIKPTPLKRLSSEVLGCFPSLPPSEVNEMETGVLQCIFNETTK